MADILFFLYIGTQGQACARPRARTLNAAAKISNESGTFGQNDLLKLKYDMQLKIILTKKFYLCLELSLAIFSDIHILGKVGPYIITSPSQGMISGNIYSPGELGNRYARKYFSTIKTHSFKTIRPVSGFQLA